MLTKSRKSFDSDSESAFISKDEYMSPHNSNILTNLITDSSEIWNKTKGFDTFSYIILYIQITY